MERVIKHENGSLPAHVCRVGTPHPAPCSRRSPLRVGADVLGGGRRLLGVGRVGRGRVDRVARQVVAQVGDLVASVKIFDNLCF